MVHKMIYNLYDFTDSQKKLNGFESHDSRYIHEIHNLEKNYDIKYIFLKHKMTF